ncbi:hypothetical protein DPMN_152213 [Dreissena polymorpha]|uniref:Uncharacterized protein n=1 Tax=Dreissena polymorpha TaxID=45954 RepID=A0A9D4FJZ9_DREPO|nr:hypothetical protein DPMN_152213 [Dreissena polymorpha]
MFGFPRNTVFPVKNYEKERMLNNGVNILALTALVQILYFAEDYIDKELSESVKETNEPEKEKRERERERAREREHKLYIMSLTHSSNDGTIPENLGVEETLNNRNIKLSSHCRSDQLDQARPSGRHEWSGRSGRDDRAEIGWMSCGGRVLSTRVELGRVLVGKFHKIMVRIILNPFESKTAGKLAEELAWLRAGRRTAEKIFKGRVLGDSYIDDWLMQVSVRPLGLLAIPLITNHTGEESRRSHPPQPDRSGE